MNSRFTLNDYLGLYGLAGLDWELCVHNGRSGARIYRLIDAARNRRWILKKTSMNWDWIMRATEDVQGREQTVAALLTLRGNGVRSVAISGFREGSNCYTLMRDVSEFLIGRRPITEAEFDAVIEGMAALHAIVPSHPLMIPWCPVKQRLSLLSQQGIGIVRDHGPDWLARELDRGWTLFFDQAPGSVVEIIRSILHDFVILERALQKLPSRLLHGDLKFDNVGLDSSHCMLLIDWAMLMYAPPAVELGWFMAINSKQINISFDDVLAIYFDKAPIDSALRPCYQALAALCGLLLRGWRKALDADAGDASELRWWCEWALEAQRFL